MKKVILLGDSIRLIGYGARATELLGEGYAVWQPEDNCRFTAYTLRMLFEYKAQLEGSDVIHFNCGLWDECDLFGDGAFTPLDTYVENLVRIAAILITPFMPETAEKIAGANLSEDLRTADSYTPEESPNLFPRLETEKVLAEIYAEIEAKAEKKEEKVERSLKYVDDRLLTMPSVALMQVKKELDYNIRFKKRIDKALKNLDKQELKVIL